MSIDRARVDHAAKYGANIVVLARELQALLARVDRAVEPLSVTVVASDDRGTR